jgi:hypothetical protein
MYWPLAYLCKAQLNRNSVLAHVVRVVADLFCYHAFNGSDLCIPDKSQSCTVFSNLILDKKLSVAAYE